MILKGISICNEHRFPEADYYLLHFRLLPSSQVAYALCMHVFYTIYLSLLSRSISDHHLRCGGWLNLEFSKREKHSGWAIKTLQEVDQRHAKTHTSGPII